MSHPAPGFYTDGRFILDENDEVVLAAPTYPPVLSEALDDETGKIYLYGTDSNYGDALDVRIANGMCASNILASGAGYYVNGVKENTENPKLSIIDGFYYKAPAPSGTPELFTGYTALENGLFYDIDNGVAELFTGYALSGYYVAGIGPSARDAVAMPAEKIVEGDPAYFDYRSLPPVRANGIFAGEDLLEGEGRYSNGGLLTNTKKTPIQSEVDDLYYTTLNGDPELFTGYAVAGYFENGIGPSAKPAIAEAYDGYGLYYDYRSLPPVKAQGIYTLKTDVLTSGEGFYIAGVKRISRNRPTTSKTDGEYYIVSNYVPSLFTGYYRTGYIDPADYPLLSTRNAVATPVDGDNFVYLDYNSLPPIRANGLYTTGGNSTLVEGEGLYTAGGFKRETRTFPTVSKSNGLYYTVSNYVPSLFTGYLTVGYITNGDISTATARNAVGSAGDRWWRADRFYDYRTSPFVRANGLYYGTGLLDGAGFYILGVKSESDIIVPTLSKIDGKYYSMIRNPNTNEFEFFLLNSWEPYGPSLSWGAIAISADGAKQTATASGGHVYISSDYGRTWTSKLHPAPWADVKMSSNAEIQLTAAYGGKIYVSSDYGASWTEKLNNGNWVNVAMSADGQKQFAIASNQPKVYSSSNSGSTWTSTDTLNNLIFGGIAVSGNGQKIILLLVTGGGQLVYSEDSGASWVQRGPSGRWSAISLSTDGSILITVVDNKMYKSTDFGYTRTEIGGNISWLGVFASPNCQYLLALSTSYVYFKSSDYGQTWVPVSQSLGWSGSAAISSNGSRMAALIRNDQIYQYL